MMRIALISVFIAFGCAQEVPMTSHDESTSPSADELFQAELTKRGYGYTRTEEGLYQVEIGDVTATVNLDNVRRNYERDGDGDAISRFADQLDEMFGDVPGWAEVKSQLRYSLEPSDYESGFEDTLHEIVTDSLVKVFVYASPDGSRITWITSSLLADWEVSREEVVEEANKNMDRLADETEFEIQEIDGVPLGMLSTQDTPFKASLILSARFRDLVRPTHGWPVYVVVPTRDFAYVIPQKNRDFLGRLGPVVVREYNESGHSITQEVLEVSDQGVRAIGSFAPK